MNIYASNDETFHQICYIKSVFSLYLRVMSEHSGECEFVYFIVLNNPLHNYIHWCTNTFV